MFITSVVERRPLVCASRPGTADEFKNIPSAFRNGLADEGFFEGDSLTQGSLAAMLGLISLLYFTKMQRIVWPGPVNRFSN